MMLKKITLPPMGQQDQLIITFQQSFTYNISHQIIFRIKHAVLKLMMLNSVKNIIQRDQKTFPMALVAPHQYRTEVSACIRDLLHSL